MAFLLRRKPPMWARKETPSTRHSKHLMGADPHPRQGVFCPSLSTASFGPSDRRLIGCVCSHRAGCAVIALPIDWMICEQQTAQKAGAGQVGCTNTSVPLLCRFTKNMLNLCRFCLVFAPKVFKAWGGSCCRRCFRTDFDDVLKLLMFWDCL